MAIYTTKLCPHCGHFYQSYSTATKNMTVKQGCPIVCCTKCGESFLDKDIKEPAFLPPEEGELNIFQMIVGLLFPFGVAGIFFLILGIVYKSMPAALISLIPFAFYAYLLYVGIKNKKEINDDIKIAYKKSKDRLSNKDYVVELIELGYKVPLSFLENNYPELIGYKRGSYRDFFASAENAKTKDNDEQDE